MEHKKRILREILKINPDVRTPSEVNIIANYFKNQEFMQKLKIKKTDEVRKQNFFSKLMYKAVKGGNDLFKINSIGHHFYMIFTGEVEVVVPVDTAK